MFVSHCILNPNIRDERFSKVKELIGLLAESDVGIIQLPCPKIECNGKFIRKIDKNCKNYCKKVSIQVLDTIEKYLDENFKVLGILGVDFSPICGVYRVSNGKKSFHGKGILIEEIEREMQKRNFQVPLISTNLNNTFSTLEKIDLLLKNS